MSMAGVREGELVTGEAVALDLPPATLAMRALSGLLDLFFLIWAGLTLLAVVAAVFFSVLDSATTAGIGVIVLVTVLVVVPALMEGLTGRTLGKMICGLRTVRDDGGPISLRHALVRHLVGFVEVFSFAGGPALVCGLLNAKSKRLGDLAAGTYVVRDRMRAPYPKAGLVPAQLARWARTADLAPLPDQLALSIRELLARAPQIRPAPRFQLAHALSRQALAYVSPGPPLGTPPEVFLEALLVERGRRDWDRLIREDALRRRLLGQPSGAGLVPLTGPGAWAMPPVPPYGTMPPVPPYGTMPPVPSVPPVSPVPPHGAVPPASPYGAPEHVVGRRMVIGDPGTTGPRYPN